MIGLTINNSMVDAFCIVHHQLMTTLRVCLLAADEEVAFSRLIERLRSASNAAVRSSFAASVAHSRLLRAPSGTTELVERRADAAFLMQEFATSQRKACELASIARSSFFSRLFSSSK